VCRRSVLAAVIALVVVLAGTAPAGASSSLTVSPTINFVGVYRLHVIFREGEAAGRIKINADGTATDTANHVAHWTSVGTTIVIASSIGGISDTFVGVRTATGIGTRKHPGTLIQYIGDEFHPGTWYAVQKP
jgi:hypothetical protein